MLRACCGSSFWVQEMEMQRPFETPNDLKDAGLRVWDSATKEDRLEAFRGHPEIGDVDSLRSKFSHDRWAEGEQAGASVASTEVFEALAAANEQYRDRFGFIFIICATGRSAPEMLSELQRRLRRSHALELDEASRQQAKITQLRLDKLVGGQE